MEKPWYQADLVEVEQTLKTDFSAGLSAEEAQTRVLKYGANELKEKQRDSLWRKFFNQLNNFLVIILLAAAALSYVVGEVTDAVVILAIVLLNAVVGVFQESKAENALGALRKMSAPNCKVLREDQVITLPSRALVPGDIVLIEAGDYIPADIRLIEAVNLRIEESALTGESVPAEKIFDPISGDISLADRRNMAYMGTVSAHGRGRGVVVDTGMRTEFGHIAHMLESFQEEETPLQKNLRHFSKTLGLICIAVCVVIFAVGLYEGYKSGHLDFSEVQLLLMTAVSLAVAAIPEGLPAIVTLVLALGMQRMVKRNVLIRKLHAVETLGSTTVICSDKTGTLTQNKMTVTRLAVAGKNVEVSGDGYRPEGNFTLEGSKFEPSKDKALETLLLGSALCNDANLKANDSQEWSVVGDPTEGALLVTAAKAGFQVAEVRRTYPRIGEIPFDSERKLMTSLHRDNQGNIIAYIKGAPDVLLARSSRIQRAESVNMLSDSDRNEIQKANADMASQALRVLAVGYRKFAHMPDKLDSDVVETDIAFLGLVGMIDPPREEARAAIELSKSAGIRPIMITGDYPATALAIAKRLGLTDTDGHILTGSQLESMSREELRHAVKHIDVYARVSPAHKVAIVDALRSNGEVAAMTGDGVNDAPALKGADIGVAMGISGTDVTKETADMVLTDDNFASIVAAVEEGRVVYSNIQKTIFFLISCNLAEIMIIFLAMMMGWPIPLLPIHLLWLNLVTDTFPAFALGLEKKEPDVMKLPPRDPAEPLLDKNRKTRIGIQSVVITIAVLSSFQIALGL